MKIKRHKKEQTLTDIENSACKVINDVYNKICETERPESCFEMCKEYAYQKELTNWEHITYKNMFEVLLSVVAAFFGANLYLDNADLNTRIITEKEIAIASIATATILMGVSYFFSRFLKNSTKEYIKVISYKQYMRWYEKEMEKTMTNKHDEEKIAFLTNAYKSKIRTPEELVQFAVKYMPADTPADIAAIKTIEDKAGEFFNYNIPDNQENCYEKKTQELASEDECRKLVTAIHLLALTGTLAKQDYTRFMTIIDSAYRKAEAKINEKK